MQLTDTQEALRSLQIFRDVPRFFERGPMQYAKLGKMAQLLDELMK